MPSNQPLIYRIPEVKVDGKPLGRHVHHDPASRGFAADKADKLVSVSHKATGLPLNQGKIGSCTANALCGAGNTAPNHKTGKTYHEKDAVQLYGLETTMEGVPYPPNDPGGTGLMVCKAAKQLGWITSYQHAFGIEHALLALVKRPAITGVSWFDSFDQPDSNGLVSIARYASIRGGHEIEADKLVVPDGATVDDLDDILVGLVQSWGKWGVADPDANLKTGRFYMTAATWNTLLKGQGDVTVPIV